MITYRPALYLAKVLIASSAVASPSALAWQAEKITDGLKAPWGLAYVNE
ncbi:PQQ-dependent sugar dehydrogenase, partial [Vibrio sp. 10N.222.55.E8]